MEATKPLYLMLSRTQTYMGKTIRLFTHYGYNHVSLSLDPRFCRWVSFARYAQGVPLAGGFVSESPERYLSSGSSVQVRIFQVNIPLSRYRKLEALFAQADMPNSGLIYNTFGALTTPIGLHLTVAGAYTCLEFADAVLGASHRSIRALDRDLLPYLIFDGPLQALVTDSGSRIGPYFVRRGPWGGTVDTTVHFARLCHRLLFGHFDPVSVVLR